MDNLASDITLPCLLTLPSHCHSFTPSSLLLLVSFLFLLFQCENDKPTTHIFSSSCLHETNYSNETMAGGMFKFIYFFLFSLVVSFALLFSFWCPPALLLWTGRGQAKPAETAVLSNNTKSSEYCATLQSHNNKLFNHKLAYIFVYYYYQVACMVGTGTPEIFFFFANRFFFQLENRSE